MVLKLLAVILLPFSICMGNKAFNLGDWKVFELAVVSGIGCMLIFLTNDK